jgi:hypothetical protein
MVQKARIFVSSGANAGQSEGSLIHLMLQLSILIALGCQFRVYFLVKLFKLDQVVRSLVGVEFSEPSLFHFGHLLLLCFELRFKRLSVLEKFTNWFQESIEVRKYGVRRQFILNVTFLEIIVNFLN